MSVLRICSLRRIPPCNALFRRTYATEVATGVEVPKPSSYGQPLFTSHPHLVKHDEITPGIPSNEYERRRSRLMQSLPENSVVVSMAGPIKYMSGEIFYKFRQASDFWYLTGFQEPNAAVILEKTSSSKGYRMTLFSRGKNSSREKWDGARTSFDEATSIFGADSAQSIDHFPSHLKSLISMYSYVYVDGTGSSLRRGRPMSLLKYLSMGQPARSEFDGIVESLSGSRRRNLAPELAKLRSIKSEAEQRVMRAAADVSGWAHAKTMRFTQPGLSESALAAHFEYLCALSGAQRLAYVPVVASGANSLIIHYTSNDHLIREGEMVLVDAGCEYNGYASDITRTYPATGTFTSPQRDLYAAVLSAQKACIALCTESSRLSLHALHHKSCGLLGQELKQIGFSLMSRDLESVLYPHFLSHPIGIDLHESSNFDRGAPLASGMVVTIEPGIYVPPTASFPKHFHNLGVRIEDEVLVQENHPVILTVNAPKEIVDVEGACQGLLGLQPY